LNARHQSGLPDVFFKVAYDFYSLVFLGLFTLL
jgi:hypothetical protein